MNKSHLVMLVVILAAYFAGAKFPGLAQKTGLV